MIEVQSRCPTYDFQWVQVKIGEKDQFKFQRFHKRHVGKVRGRPYHSRLTDGFKRKRGRLTGSIAGRGNTGKFVKFGS